MRSVCTHLFLLVLFLTSSSWFNSLTAPSQHLKGPVSLTALFFKGKKMTGSTDTNSSQSLLELISFALENSKASHELQFSHLSAFVEDAESISSSPAYFQ